MSLFRRRLMITNALKKSSGINYPGLIAAWSAKGKTNDDEDRAILKDLTGNGHDITLNGFAFSEMSGYGGYNTNFLSSNKWITGNSANLKGEYTSSKAILSKGSAGFISNNFRYISYDYLKFRFKTNANCDLQIYIKANNENDIKTIKVIKDEPTEIEFEDVNNLEGITQRWCYFNISTNNLPEEGLIIEQLPNYPDALVLDGVDDYGFCENIPLLKEYTIIAKRKDCSGGCLINKGVNANGAFVLEGYEFTSNTYNYGQGQNKNLLRNDIITWQNINSYNQQSLIIGNKLDTTNNMYIGRLYDTDPRILKGAFYSAYLFDRSLDEQEIKEFIRKYIDPEYLLPSEIPTPDCYYDFSLGSNDDENRETIKDQSGNGNDAKAYNIAWAGMSGYGGYNLLITQPVKDRFEYEHKDGLFIFKKALSSGTHIFSIPLSSIYDDFQISIQNIGTKTIQIVGSNSGTVLNEFTTNGIFQIKKNELPEGIIIKMNYVGDEDLNNLTIEFLPQYPGALVLDGVDDHIVLEAFINGFKTIFMVCKPFIGKRMLYDQRNNLNSGIVAIYNETSSIAYYSRSANGTTYINNKINTKIKSEDLLNVKHNIVSINRNYNTNSSNNYHPVIGTVTAKNNYFANMAIYKFLGFKEELTEEQIQAIIKKYNLLDGVDEIEVS